MTSVKFVAQGESILTGSADKVKGDPLILIAWKLKVFYLGPFFMNMFK